MDAPAAGRENGAGVVARALWWEFLEAEQGNSMARLELRRSVLAAVWRTVEQHGRGIKNALESTGDF